MKIAVGCILKKENHYLREWVEWYLSLGVGMVYVADNNDIGGEQPMDVLHGLMDKVTIIDYRGEKGSKGNNIQAKAYNFIYQLATLGGYEWVGMLDIDEFVRAQISLSKILERVKCDVLRVCWKCYDDNDLEYVADGNYSVSRFTRLIENTEAGEKDIYFGLNRQCKCFVRCGNGKIFFATSHTLTNKDIKAENVKGCECNNRSRYIGAVPVYGDCWIDHYPFKTIEEYCEKIKRGYPCHDLDEQKQLLTIDNFFRFNKRTNTKDYIAKKILQNG